MVGALRNIS